MDRGKEIYWLRKVWDSSGHNFDTFCRRVADRLAYLETMMAAQAEILADFAAGAENERLIEKCKTCTIKEPSGNNCLPCKGG